MYNYNVTQKVMHLRIAKRTKYGAKDNNNMHMYLLNQRHTSETRVVAVTLNFCTIVEALATSGYDEKDR